MRYPPTHKYKPYPRHVYNHTYRSTSLYNTPPTGFTAPQHSSPSVNLGTDTTACGYGIDQRLHGEIVIGIALAFMSFFSTSYLSEDFHVFSLHFFFKHGTHEFFITHTHHCVARDIIHLGGVWWFSALPRFLFFFTPLRGVRGNEASERGPGKRIEKYSFLIPGAAFLEQRYHGMRPICFFTFFFIHFTPCFVTGCSCL